MAPLTTEQRALLKQAAGEILRLFDPDTSEQYVLIRVVGTLRRAVGFPSDAGLPSRAPPRYYRRRAPADRMEGVSSHCTTERACDMRHGGACLLDPVTAAAVRAKPVQNCLAKGGRRGSVL